MTSSLDDRKNAFENKFAHDQQLQFRAEAKACKAMGLWAAGQMGLDTASASAYANDLVVSNLDEPGLDDVVDKVEADFKAKGVMQIRGDIKAQLDQFYAQAKDALMNSVQG
jgi:hypothetical protein